MIDWNVITVVYGNYFWKKFVRSWKYIFNFFIDLKKESKTRKAGLSANTDVARAYTTDFLQLCSAIYRIVATEEQR